MAETRSNKLEVKTDGGKLFGMAAVFDSPTTITERGRTFTEVVRRGAFDRALKENRDILICFNHDTNQLLGRTGSGTARVWADSRGLMYEVQLPASASHIRELVERGDVSGCSFSFGVRKDKWTDGTRELLDLDLMECGPVVMPAYGSTSLGLRSTDMMKQKVRLMELQVQISELRS